MIHEIHAWSQMSINPRGTSKETGPVMFQFTSDHTSTKTAKTLLVNFQEHSC